MLEGGAAFGTGDHPTTRMCVNWLSRIFQQKRCFESAGQRAEKWSLLDYGCGSAILALGEFISHVLLFSNSSISQEFLTFDIAA